MGVKTYATFRSDLVFETGQRTDIDSYTGQWTNTSYLEFCTRRSFWEVKIPKHFKFPELDTTTTSNTTGSVAYISIPTDCLAVYTIHDTTNDKKLKNYNMRQYVEETGRASTTGFPDYWLRYGSRIYFFPTPTGVYSMTIWYRKRPALLSAVGDVTLIGSEWDEPILKLAVAQTLLRLKDYEGFKIHKAEWVNMMEGKMGMYDEERKDKEDILHPDLGYLGY